MAVAVARQASPTPWQLRATCLTYSTELAGEGAGLPMCGGPAANHLLLGTLEGCPTKDE